MINLDLPNQEGEESMEDEEENNEEALRKIVDELDIEAILRRKRAEAGISDDDNIETEIIE